MKSFILKNKVIILSVLLVVSSLRSCVQSNRSEFKEIKINELNNKLDSLNIIIGEFPNKLKMEKLKIHVYYDDYISEKDRGKQLMELHMEVKNNIKKIK